ncbi:Crp/Fnr family transcriptional regulator [Falsiroseomonas sp. CW058]|uniref:Crp/Fnr family transcriptional regulator n=1 Tax=Falsiroseomonas sp. CW058 TaxID=3388664 RepID=UPI003D31C827
MRRAVGFQDFSDAEFGFMSELKAEHRRVPAGADLFQQDDAPTHVFTAFSGWAYRYRLFGDGRRQILGVVLPGELVGVPGAAFGRHAYAVRAATEAEFCALSLARLPALLREQEGLSMRLLWLSSHEQRMVERLAISLGRCTAEETLAAFSVDLRERLLRRGMTEEGGLSFAFPLGQAEVADHLGMTIVHLNRVLRKLEQQKILVVRRGRMEILDLDRLRKLSCLHEPADMVPQPLL